MATNLLKFSPGFHKKSFEKLNKLNIMRHCKIVQSLQENSQLQNLLLSIVIIQAASVQSKFCSIFHLVDRELTVVVVIAVVGLVLATAICAVCENFPVFFIRFLRFLLQPSHWLCKLRQRKMGRRKKRKNWNRSSSSWNCATIIETKREMFLTLTVKWLYLTVLIMTLANNPTNDSDNQHHRVIITTTSSKHKTITFPQWAHNIIGY